MISLSSIFKIAASNIKLIGFGLLALIIFWVVFIAIDRVTLIEKVKNFEATETQTQERNKTNDDVRKMSDADKCELLGGVFANGTCQ